LLGCPATQQRIGPLNVFLGYRWIAARLAERVAEFRVFASGI
jgi:hypothetical protein